MGRLYGVVVKVREGDEGKCEGKGEGKGEVV